jgi:hypothetical protein
MYWVITIRDTMFGELKGEVKAETRQEAIDICREQYALELDTNMENIEIVKVEKGKRLL